MATAHATEEDYGSLRRQCHTKWLNRGPQHRGIAQVLGCDDEVGPV